MRDSEWDLQSLGADQTVASLVWGPLAGGLLGGKYGRGGMPVISNRADALPASQLLDIIDCLGEVARETGASQAQVALAWLLQRPTVATVLVGASSAEQLEASLDAIELELTGDQYLRLDEVSARPAPYPHGLQRGAGGERNLRPGNAGNMRVDKAFAGSAPQG